MPRLRRPGPAPRIVESVPVVLCPADCLREWRAARAAQPQSADSSALASPTFFLLRFAPAYQIRYSVTLGPDLIPAALSLPAQPCQLPPLPARWLPAQSIPLTATFILSRPPAPPARQFWFACPRCQRRTSRLYLPPRCSRLACRQCHRLEYRCDAAGTGDARPRASARDLDEWIRSAPPASLLPRGLLPLLPQWLRWQGEGRKRKREWRGARVAAQVGQVR